MAVEPRSRETGQRLETCWELSLDWALFESNLKKVCTNSIKLYVAIHIDYVLVGQKKVYTLYSVLL